MITRIAFFLTGFGLSVIGFVFIISYMNLITLGYNFEEYVQFIISRPECLIAPIGLLTIFLSIYIPGGKNDELCI
mgnify:CR=1 FL=1